VNSYENNISTPCRDEDRPNDGLGDLYEDQDNQNPVPFVSVDVP